MIFDSVVVARRRKVMVAQQSADADRDLHLATGERSIEAGDVAFAEGLVVDQLTEPAYDVDRDTAS